MARLAAFEHGEVHFTAIMTRDTGPADLEQFRSFDDEGGWDTSCGLEFSLDLPGARIMGAAIGGFLAEHETTGCAVPEIEDRDRRPARAQLAKPLTPKTRYRIYEPNSSADWLRRL